MASVASIADAELRAMLAQAATRLVAAGLALAAHEPLEARAIARTLLDRADSCFADSFN